MGKGGIVFYFYFSGKLMPLKRARLAQMLQLTQIQISLLVSVTLEVRLKKCDSRACLVRMHR